MRERIIITNGELGSDNTLFFDYNRHSWQGRKRIEYWAKYLANRSGAGIVCAYTQNAWQFDGKPFTTFYFRKANQW